jgi:hypothetical protein
MTDDEKYSFHINKKPGKTYVSRRLDYGLRIASKVIDSEEFFYEAMIKDEVVLRRTPRGRQEIVAKFFEDERHLRVVTLQRWNSFKGRPQENTYFSFTSGEIEKLLTFLTNIVNIHFPDAEKLNVSDSALRSVMMKEDQAKALLAGDLDLFIRFAENEITEHDIVALGYRRKQLAHFERLLNDTQYFAEQAQGRATESVWQAFFEANPWIFGYGLSYIFMDPLSDRKLEQTVRGSSIAESGKRADALMKTRAEVSSLCFVEIKRHDTPLLSASQYRKGVWAPSQDLVGGIAQIQETVRGAVKTISAPFRPTDEFGSPTGEEIHGFEPRSFLVIGRLAEFESEYGLNEGQFRSFEIFRRNIRQPEIITFDELYHRARFITNADSPKRAVPDVE